MNAPGLVIFDCDGVLVDSERISMRELTQALAREGGTLSRAEVEQQFVGLALVDVVAAAERHLGRALPDGWLDRFLTERAEAFERELRPVPGAVESVEAVRALGWETCVASGGRMEKMAQTLRVTGLAGLFPPGQIFSATMVACGKPAPDLFLHAADACGYSPASCIVVEDSVPGVTAGRAAGMRTFGYTAGSSAVADRLESGGAEPLADLRALPVLLAADARKRAGIAR